MLNSVTPRSVISHLFVDAARPPAVIWLPALVIAALLLISPVYLAIRTVGAGPDAAELIFRTRTFWVVLRTLSLMAAVMVGCIVIAVPLAWLSVRTDLPWRGFWRVATMLPLALPSYIVGFAIAIGLGPRGILQDWLEVAFGVERLPSIYGFPGAAFTLIIISFPYVLLTVRAALWNLDAALEESARALGHNRWQTFWRVTLPMLRPAILVGGLLTALYTMGDFGAVAMMRYETFTWSIFIQYGAALNRTLAAAWSLALIALALAVVWGEHSDTRSDALLPQRRRCDASPGRGAVGTLALAGSRLLRTDRAGYVGIAHRRVGVLDGAGSGRRGNRWLCCGGRRQTRSLGRNLPAPASLHRLVNAEHQRLGG